MVPNLRNPRWQAVRRRLCGGVTLLAYLIAAIGFPLPQTLGHMANACGQEVCGCGTPEQCKANGCGCSHDGSDAAPQEPEPADCCSFKHVNAVPSCCAKKSTPEQMKTPKKAKGNTIRWVVGIAALKCRGGPVKWLSAETALPTTAPLTWQPSWPFCYSLSLTHQSRFVLSADPSDPPPRLEAV